MTAWSCRSWRRCAAARGRPGSAKRPNVDAADLSYYIVIKNERCHEYVQKAVIFVILSMCSMTNICYANNGKNLLIARSRIMKLFIC